VRLEGEDAGAGPARVGQLEGAGQQRPVAEVDAVEVADGHGAARQVIARGGQ
jgi:hypothetical protein